MQFAAWRETTYRLENGRAHGRDLLVPLGDEDHDPYWPRLQVCLKDAGFC